MLFLLSPAMLKSIEEQVAKVRKSGGMLDVYKIAEKIRVQHIHENVAREDIMEKLMFFAGNVPIELNSNCEDESLFPVTNGASLNGSSVLVDNQ